MSLGVRGKLFAVSVLVVVAVGVPSGLYLERALRGWLEARIEAELTRSARTASEALAPFAAGGGDALDSVADRLGETTGARVSVIGEDGRVLGDSELAASAMRTVENHGRRPEVIAALEGGLGRSRRYSTTVRTEMLYVAVPFAGPSARGVVRLAVPLAEVDEAVGRLRVVLVAAGLLGLALAVLASGLASQVATRALRRLVDNARSAVRGEGTRRLAIASTDELGRLAGSFNRMAEELDRTVAELAGERDHLETILDGLDEGVLTLDADRRVTRLNRAARDLLGRPPSLGEPLLETVRVPGLAELALSHAEGTAEVELPGARHVQAQAAPLRTGGRVVVLRDVTRTRRLEQVRRDFVANVSHELRTPVSVIRANAETLLDGAVDDRERARTFLEGMHRSAERLSALVSDLLDLARLDAGRYDLAVGPVAVAKVAAAVLAELRGPAEARGLALDVDAPVDVQVRADPRALEQVLHNLVDNAMKYASRSGRVTVRAIASPDEVRVEVEDDGPGLERRHRERVFERFYRVDPGRSREVGGTGLGLSIVKHLVETLHGSVGVDPGRPNGSVFWFTLPRAR